MERFEERLKKMEEALDILMKDKRTRDESLEEELRNPKPDGLAEVILRGVEASKRRASDHFMQPISPDAINRKNQEFWNSRREPFKTA